MKHERTSKRVAKIAAKVLASDGLRTAMLMQRGSTKRYAKAWYLQWSELKALAASCLTQTADRSKPNKAAVKRVMRRVNSGEIGVREARKVLRLRARL